MQQLSLYYMHSNQTVLSDTVDNEVTPAGRLWWSLGAVFTSAYPRYLLPYPALSLESLPTPFLSSGYICQSNTQHLPVNPSCVHSPLANLSGPLLMVNVWLCPVVNSSPLHHLSICPFRSCSCCSVTSGNLAHLYQNRYGEEQKARMV